MSAPVTPYARAHAAMLKARMNCIYYEREISRVQRWDRWLRLTSILLSSGGVTLAIKAFKSDWLAIAAGCVAAAVTGITIVYQYSERAKAAASMLPQYVDVFNQLRHLVDQGDELDEEKLKAALASLDQLAVSEAKEIRTNDPELLAEAQERVLQEQGLDQDA